VVITEGDLALAAEDPSLNLPNISPAQKREILIQYMVDLKTGARAAEAEKLGEGPEFARKVAYFRDKILLDEYIERETKKAVTPEAARKLYDEAFKDAKPEEERRASHILVEGEEEAKAILARLKAGEDFKKLATELSKDPGSGQSGGDLGFFTRERMVEPFAEAAFKLEPGQLSDPVKTQFGWHVIRLEEKRQKPVPTFDEVRPQVDAYLTRKTQQDIVLGLRQKSKIERLDQPAAAPNPTAAPNPAAAPKPADAPKP
jgi:peptidyl-prolyl cis-trans isomerase C